MSAQINIKIDPKLKKEVEKVVEALGFNLSSVTKAFFLNLIRTKRIDFSLEEEDTDTPADLTGEKLEKDLIEYGYSKKYAKREREAYENMLADKKAGRLIRM